MLLNYESVMSVLIKVSESFFPGRSTCDSAKCLTTVLLLGNSLMHEAIIIRRNTAVNRKT